MSQTDAGTGEEPAGEGEIQIRRTRGVTTPDAPGGPCVDRVGRAIDTLTASETCPGCADGDTTWRSALTDCDTVPDR